MKKTIGSVCGKVKKWYEDSGCNPLKEQYYDTKASAQATYILGAVFAVLVFVIYYLISFFFYLDNGLQDIKAHTRFAMNFYLEWDKFFEAWKRMPYLMWHIIVKMLVSRFGFPEADAASFTNAIFGVFFFFVVTFLLYKLTRYYTGRKNLLISLVGAMALTFAGPLCCMWYGDAYFGGSFSINPMHNPTQTAVKGFGILLFMAGVDIIRKYKNLDTIFFSSKLLYFRFGLFLFLSTIAKPTFMYMLLPAGMVVILTDMIVSAIKKDRNLGKIWGACWRITVACIPSLMYLLLEYFAFYFWGDATNNSSVIITTPFLVWKIYALSIRKSVFLGMCFPLWMVITNPGYFFRQIEGRLSLASYFIGTAEFSFLAESGERMDAGNFAWCMMSGMLVLFVIAAQRLILRTTEKKEGMTHVVYVIFSWFLLFLHVFSWLYYYGVFREML